MKFIVGEKGTGKTTKLLYMSMITSCPIITETESQAKHLKRKANILGLDIPEPMSFTEFKYLDKTKYPKQILIDNGEHIIENALKQYLGAEVRTITLDIP